MSIEPPCRVYSTGNGIPTGYFGIRRELTYLTGLHGMRELWRTSMSK